MTDHTTTADELRNEYDDPWEAMADLKNENERLKEELAEYKDHVGRELADVRGRISDVEEEPQSGGSTPRVGGSKTGSQNSPTPLERICRTPEHQVDQLDLTVNQERARFVAKGIADYADKAPAGLVVDSSTIKKVMAAKEGERPHNQTVARIMKFMDKLGKETVQVKQRRGRNIVVVDPDSVNWRHDCGDGDGRMAVT